MDAHEVTQEILDLYERFGKADYIGEPVSQIEHMSQAAVLALQAHADDEVVLAAFFHDIGHICVQHDPQLKMESYGVKSHEQIGADFLRKKGFPERMAKLVENHVNAKRYLTWKEPEYFSQLSEASKLTLKFQGGVMSEQEAKKFESDPLFEASILLRKWDEAAKETNLPLVDLGMIREKCLKILSN
jgi:2-amino-1-hydroxyethylphosphonate dioxygenase (glycine-forming)